MLKHSALTLGRINSMLRLQIHENIIAERKSLEVKFCPSPHKNERDARKKGPWDKVEPGFTFGPAYNVFWFQVIGNIPLEWDGLEVAMHAELGGERTVWINNVPERGIDGPHTLYRIADKAVGGQKLDFAIQTHAGNPSVRLIGQTPPRQDKTATFKNAELVLIRTYLQELSYDVEFALSLLSAQVETDPSYATLLRALNEVCNVINPLDPDSVKACRKLIKDAIGALLGEVKHSITAVGHAHLDTAWLWPLDITHLKMAHTTANQLYLMNRYPKYVFVHSQASQFEWLEKEYPELLQKVKDKVITKQWEIVGSMWVEADCNITGSESLIRQFLYGRRYFEKHFGHPTDDMWLPDVFGYSAALPQILKKFDIKYFLTQKISWNQFNKFPHNTFWWQGIDGSKIWSHFPPADTYVGDGTPKQILQSVSQHKDQARSDMSLYIFGHGDGGGGPTEQHLEYLNRAKIANNMPELRTDGLAREFFKEAKASGKDLMTWVGELYLEMHRGTFTSQANNKKWNRECEFLLRDAEWLQSFSPNFPDSYPAEKLEQTWKLVLLNQFHDIIPGSSVREVYEDSDRDYAKVISDANDIITEGLVRIGKHLAPAGLENPIALFSNAEISTQAEIELLPEDGSPSSLQFDDERIPIQIVEQIGQPRKAIFALPVEALGTVSVCGFSELPPTQLASRLKARDRKIENDNWVVKFDVHGNITSIVCLDDRASEFVAPGQLANVFQIFDDHPNFWGAWDIDAFAFETKKDIIKSESFEIVERGPVRVAVELVKKFGKSTIKQRISLGPTPGIRFDTEIDWHEDHKLLKVAFPVNVNAQRASYEIQFGHVERPTHYNTSWDTARFEVPAQKWVDLCQGDMGVALINTGKYGYDINANVIRMSLLRSPKAPDPMCDMGKHCFSYVLLPHFEQLAQSDVIATAYSQNSPLRVARIQPGTAEKSALPTLAKVESRNLRIESIKKAEDSVNLIVRLYECHNTRGRAWFRCIRPIKGAWITNLNEEIIQELEIIDGSVQLEFLPFEILTLMVQLA